MVPVWLVVVLVTVLVVLETVVVDVSVNEVTVDVVVVVAEVVVIEVVVVPVPVVVVPVAVVDVAVEVKHGKKSSCAVNAATVAASASDEPAHSAFRMPSRPTNASVCCRSASIAGTADGGPSS